MLSVQSLGTPCLSYPLASLPRASFLTASPQIQKLLSEFPMYSAATDSQPLNLNMESIIISSLLQVLRCMLNLVPSTLRSSLPPRRSSPPWRRLVSLGGLHLLGLLLFTWSRRRMEVGGPVEIIVTKTTSPFPTDAHYLTSLFSPLE